MCTHEDWRHRAVVVRDRRSLRTACSSGEPSTSCEQPCTGAGRSSSRAGSHGCSFAKSLTFRHPDFSWERRISSRTPSNFLDAHPAYGRRRRQKLFPQNQQGLLNHVVDGPDTPRAARPWTAMIRNPHNPRRGTRQTVLDQIASRLAPYARRAQRTLKAASRSARDIFELRTIAVRR